MDNNIPTSIHTRVNDKYRISSIYREWANSNFSQWGWETLLWEKVGDEEKIVEEFSVSQEVETVIDEHAWIYNQIKDNDGIWKRYEM